MVFLHKHHFDGSQLKRMHVIRLPLSTSAQNRVINAGVWHHRERRWFHTAFKREDATLWDGGGVLLLKVLDEIREDVARGI